jgi:purine-cytosine permease-like protein
MRTSSGGGADASASASSFRSVSVSVSDVARRTPSTSSDKDVFFVGAAAGRKFGTGLVQVAGAITATTVKTVGSGTAKVIDTGKGLRWVVLVGLVFLRAVFACRCAS